MQAQFPIVETGNFTHPIDATDVMTVQPRDLYHALRVLVDDGHALALFQGADDGVRAGVEAAFWRSFKGPERLGNATLLRFWAMVDVMKHSRLKAMFLERGFTMLDHVAAACATQRMNVRFGFVPQRVAGAVHASERSAAEARRQQPMVSIFGTRAA